MSYGNNELFIAVPTSNVLGVLRIKSFSSLEKQFKDSSSTQKEFFNNFLMQGAFSPYSHLREILSKSSDSIEMMEFQNRQFLLSSYLGKSSEVNFMFSFSLKNRLEKKVIINAFEHSSHLIKVKEVKGCVLFEVKGISKVFPLYFVINSGIICFSSSLELLELSVIQQFSDSSLLNDLTFSKLVKVSHKGDFDNLFINLLNFKSFASQILSLEWRDHLSLISAIDNWAEYDIDYKHDQLIFNGIILSKFKENYFQSIFNNRGGQLSLDRAYPASSQSVINYSFNGIELKSRLVNDFLISHYADSCKAFLGNISSEELKQRITPFAELINGEFGLCNLDTLRDSLSYNQALFIKISNSTFAVSALSAFQKSINSNLTLSEVWKVDSDTQLDIYNGLPLPLMNAFFSPFFSRVPNKYLAVFDNYLVIANDKEIIKRVFKNCLVKNTLHNNTLFSEYRRHFSSNENLFIYTLCSKQSFLAVKSKQLNALHKQKSIFGAQLFVKDGITYSSIVVDFNLKASQIVPYVWRSQLDTTLQHVHTQVINPISKEKFFVVQDSKYNLYLINGIGRIVWKLPLEGVILGDVHQLSVKGKDDNLLVFNTSNKVYLIDFDGNSVGNFPVVLPARSSCGLALFDYENNGDIRLFVACDDDEIRVFDKKGNIVVGFQTNKLEGKILNPIQHFVVSEKDYLVFSDGITNRILDRKGNMRIVIKRPFDKNESSNFFFLNEGKENYFVTSNSDGEIVKIAIPSGDVSLLAGLSNSLPHFFSLVEYQKGKFGYLFVTQNLLLLKDLKGDILFKQELKVGIMSNVFIITNRDGSRSVSFLDKKSSIIYLYNLVSAKLEAGFPRYGEVSFLIDFNKDGLISTIGGGDNGSLIYY